MGFLKKCDKIMIAKLCLANFKKRLSVLYEQLSKSKKIVIKLNYKQFFTKKDESLRFEVIAGDAK